MKQILLVTPPASNTEEAFVLPLPHSLQFASTQINACARKISGKLGISVKDIVSPGRLYARSLGRTLLIGAIDDLCNPKIEPDILSSIFEPQRGSSKERVSILNIRQKHFDAMRNPRNQYYWIMISETKTSYPELFAEISLPLKALRKIVAVPVEVTATAIPEGLRIVSVPLLKEDADTRTRIAKTISFVADSAKITPEVLFSDAQKDYVTMVVNLVFKEHLPAPVETTTFVQYLQETYRISFEYAKVGSQIKRHIDIIRPITDTTLGDTARERAEKYQKRFLFLKERYCSKNK